MDCDVNLVRLNVVTKVEAHELIESYPSLSADFLPRLLIDGRDISEVVDGFGGSILDVAAFFKSLTSSGRLPMFTCTCGDFGCGGWWCDVEHTDSNWILRNAYDPLSPVAEDAELIIKFGLAAPWADVVLAAQHLDRDLEKAREMHPARLIQGGPAGSLLNDIRLSSFWSPRES